MVHSQTDNRVGKLARALEEHGGDAFFASNPVSMEYLHGFGEDGYERFLTLGVNQKGDVVLICPALSATYAKRCGIKDVRSWTDSESPDDLFRELAEEWNLRTGIVYLCGFMHAFMALEMQEMLPAALFKSGQKLLAQIMRTKDESELELMRRAATIADHSFTPALNRLRKGMTESDMCIILQDEMQKLGGKPTFCIVAAGPNSAEPHHDSDSTVIKEGDVLLCDFGCSVGGYNSDTTRTVAVGRAPELAQDVYKIVYEAQQKARNRVRAGELVGEVDRAARDTICGAGYCNEFIHRTGHGIGLRGHEEPFIVPGSDESLEVGECFSVEPGVYLPGRFGIRIENIVTPTKQGHESFNQEPPEDLLVVRFGG